MENGRIEEAIEKLIDRLQRGTNVNLKRKIVNFVRSFIVPDVKVICRSLTGIIGLCYFSYSFGLRMPQL